VPRRLQSGERDYDGRVSMCNDAMIRTALYEADQVLLTCTGKWSRLKAWGIQVAWWLPPWPGVLLLSGTASAWTGRNSVGATRLIDNQLVPSGVEIVMIDSASSDYIWWVERPALHM
jgi:hypothetical protein